MKENNIEKDIIKKFEKFCENLYVFKDDDMGGHFEKIVGNQRANTTLGYLVFKENLEEKLSDYKRVLKENEELKFKERSRIIGKYGDAEIHDVINRTLSNDYIPVQKVKDKIKKEIKYHEKNILDIENITMLKGKTAKEEAEIEFNKYAIVVLKKALQELIEGRE